MIKEPLLAAAYLVLVECFVLFVSGIPRFKKYFTFIPAVFWIYFIPMLSSTFGIIDPKCPVYNTISQIFLPMSLVLLLTTSDLRSIWKLGGAAIFMMLAGSLGTMLGVCGTFYIFKGIVGSELWSGFGALSGSWIGGSANMIAVKEALSTPDNVFAPMVIVDTVVPYAWMGILVISVSLQGWFDKWNRSDTRLIADLGERVKGLGENNGFVFSPLKMAFIIGFAFIAGQAARMISLQCPEIKNMFTSYSWMIIIVSFMGMAFSFTRLKAMERYGAAKIGYIFLYLVLTTIGAKSNIVHFRSAIVLIGAGFVIIAIHAIILLAAARIIRAPMFLVAAASQANIGGVASAPLVAAIYQPGLASVGLILAIFGNIIGTYLGIITGQICYILSTHS